MARDDRSRLTPSEGRKFGITVGAAFSLLGALTLWREHGEAAAVLFTVGGLLVASGILLPTRLDRVQRLWMRLAHAISRITTPIFMGVVFYFVLTPVGLARRAFARNPLRQEGQEGTYWVTRCPDERTDFERQF